MTDGLRVTLSEDEEKKQLRELRNKLVGRLRLNADQDHETLRVQAELRRVMDRLRELGAA